jgi:hypothetical protein
MTHELRLWFEWGTGCVWGEDAAAWEAFGFGSIEDRLPLSEGLKARLAEMCRWHDTALDWEYPPDPSPWSREEFDAFEDAVHEVLPRLREELGPDFSVRYCRLGGYEGLGPSEAQYVPSRS